MVYYTYVHYTADTNKIFYVGKGAGKRHKLTTNRNKWWHHKVAKHGGFVSQIMSYWDNEEDALEHEKFLIDCLEDIDVSLVNIMKSKGKEAGNKKLSPEQCKKWGEASKKKWASLDEDTRKQWSLLISQANKGRSLTAEHKQNLAQARKGLKVHKIWKAVKCVTTGIVYPSLTEAALSTGCDPSHVAKCCKGKLKKTNNMEFKYD
jgi:PIN domain nuclease of toxin-antitoxin system